MPAFDPTIDLKAPDCWGRCTALIQTLAARSLVEIADVYLVGSWPRGEVHRLSDIDIVLVVKGPHSLTLLREFRSHVVRNMQQQGLGSCSLKVFSVSGVASAAEYDGFRLYEYQVALHSFLGSGLLEKCRPRLTPIALQNSLAIQICYEFLVGTVRGRSWMIEVQKRWQRNRNIAPNLEGAEIEHFARYVEIVSPTDCLVRAILAAAMERRYETFTQLFGEYFRSIPHEFVNKSWDYARIVSQNA